MRCVEATPVCRDRTRGRRSAVARAASARRSTARQQRTFRGPRAAMRLPTGLRHPAPKLSDRTRPRPSCCCLQRLAGLTGWWGVRGGCDRALHRTAARARSAQPQPAYECSAHALAPPPSVHMRGARSLVMLASLLCGRGRRCVYTMGGGVGCAVRGCVRHAPAQRARGRLLEAEARWRGAGGAEGGNRSPQVAAARARLGAVCVGKGAGYGMGQRGGGLLLIRRRLPR